MSRAARNKNQDQHYNVPGGVWTLVPPGIGTLEPFIYCSYLSALFCELCAFFFSFSNATLSNANVDGNWARMPRDIWTNLHSVDVELSTSQLSPAYAFRELRVLRVWERGKWAGN